MPYMSIRKRIWSAAMAPKTVTFMRFIVSKWNTEAYRFHDISSDKILSSVLHDTVHH